VNTRVTDVLNIIIFIKYSNHLKFESSWKKFNIGDKKNSVGIKNKTEKPRYRPSDLGPSSYDINGESASSDGISDVSSITLRNSMLKIRDRYYYNLLSQNTLNL
jgi:hypothetical protein